MNTSKSANELLIKSVSNIDYSILGVTIIVSTMIGVYFGFWGKKTNPINEDLFSARDRNMKIFPIAMSLVASQISGVALMTVPAEIYAYGAQYYTMCLSMVITVIIINYVFIPVFFNNQTTNCYQYLDLRFGRPSRQLSTAIFLISFAVTIPVLIFVPALAFSQLSGVNVHIVNLLVSTVCVTYTMLGGLKAVFISRTDVFQGIIIIVTSTVVVLIGVYNVGGFTEVWNIADKGNRLRIFNMTFDLTTRLTFWNTSLGYIAIWTSYIGLNQACIQRIVTVPTIIKAQQMMWTFLIVFIAVLSVNCFTGIIMYAKYADCDPVKAGIVERADKMIAYFAHDILDSIPGMTGFFMSAIFCCALSTMSASLNALSEIVYFDCIRKTNWFVDNAKNANIIMKVLVAVIGVYCVLMGLVTSQFPQILQLLATISGMSDGAMFGIFILGVLFPIANLKGALIGPIFSIIVMIWIIVNGQILIFSGELVYPPMDSSIHGCCNSIMNTTINDIQTASISPKAITNESFSIYKISFTWYTFIGAAICIIIGLLVSSCTKDSKPKNLHPRLFSPLIHRFLSDEIKKNESKIETLFIDKI